MNIRNGESFLERKAEKRWQHKHSWQIQLLGFSRVNIAKNPLFWLSARFLIKNKKAKNCVNTKSFGAVLLHAQSFPYS